ncbi:tripartite tricarboxylate transporter permease [Bosea sp. 117]|uniref:tripartite tricarboxylate transporter permease n=1 Tax=Bosea sp. 117 TaxID=1125973 RepID=UPI000494CCA5|nr:tripartite tricarboxylate transporter permease [Bosea sp. 117]
MEFLDHLQLGIETAFSLSNLFYCLVGVVLGTLIGVLPGLGPVPTIAMLLPLTFGLPPVSALIMLSGIYYGAQYGGSTTSILLNLPGESASVVTVLDGYQMARRGRAGVALATAAIGSFVAGTVATLVLAMFAPPLARVALNFGPAEYFSLMVLGLIASVILAHGPLVRALAMIVLGLLLGLIGTDVTSGTLRYTFGRAEMADGINFVIVAMGMFGLGEIMRNLESSGARGMVVEKITRLMPTREDFRRMAAPILRGTVLGSALGILPGGGAMLSSFASYSLEKKLSKHPDEFGRGAIEGVAAPESANNAGAQTSYIPMLTLGIPSNPVMALMIGALIIQGIQPGPGMITEQAPLFWGIVVSMWIGNLLLLVLNLPMVGLWVRLLTIPYYMLFPVVLVISAIGVYSLNNSAFDVYLMAAFCVLGYVFSRLRCEPAPLLLGFVLGPMMEEYLRRTMLLSRGDPLVLITRPISAALLAVATLGLLMVLLPAFRRKREQIFVEDD